MFPFAGIPFLFTGGGGGGGREGWRGGGWEEGGVEGEEGGSHSRSQAVPIPTTRSRSLLSHELVVRGEADEWCGVRIAERRSQIPFRAIGAISLFLSFQKDPEVKGEALRATYN